MRNWMRASVAVAPMLMSACDVQPPGELLGEYEVRGALTANTCGNDALPANDPLQFQVQIRQDEYNALWLLQPPARPGTLQADGEFDFEVESVYPVDPEDAQNAPEPFAGDPEAFTDEAALEMFDPASATARQCTLIVTERMRGTLRRDLQGWRDGFEQSGDAEDDEDGGAAARSDEDPSLDLIGDNEIEIRAASGSDCGLVMQSAGGPFAELPCHAHYDIEGRLLEE